MVMVRVRGRYLTPKRIEENRRDNERREEKTIDVETTREYIKEVNRREDERIEEKRQDDMTFDHKSREEKKI
jgi:hypothetical protein